MYLLQLSSCSVVKFEFIDEVLVKTEQTLRLDVLGYVNAASRASLTTPVELTSRLEASWLGCTGTSVEPQPSQASSR